MDADGTLVLINGPGVSGLDPLSLQTPVTLTPFPLFINLAAWSVLSRIPMITVQSTRYSIVRPCFLYNGRHDVLDISGVMFTLQH